MRQFDRQQHAVARRRHPRWGLAFSCVLAASLPAAALAKSGPRDETATIEFFEKNVRPLLVANCYTCHSADTNSRGGLRVDDRNGLLVGGGRGAAIIPGRPEESLLFKAVSRVGNLKMPPERPLSAGDVAILKQWIRDGAAWTKVESLSSDGPIKADYQRLRKEHWAWQPLREPHIPPVRDSTWPRDDIDRFLLVRMAKAGLKPVGDSAKLPLIRRATFDLTGLPPTPAEIDAFLADRSETAFERVVDRLLASPAFGERWGRHWLDVARYGESTGSARNLPYPHAWRYRDYVIDAFNNDKPYDEFLREQIAGDLLPAATSDLRAEHLIATGFLALGVKDVNQRFKVRFVMDNIDEQIDTVSRSVLALTASCARCHDHKFDPIPTADYYALAGIFQSTDLCAALRNKMGGGGLDYYDPQLLLRIGRGAAAVPPSAEKIERLKKEWMRARANLASLRNAAQGSQQTAEGQAKLDAARQKVNRLQTELARLNDPAANGPVALGARDARIVADAAIRIRGEAEKHGPVVPRGFLGVVQFLGEPVVNISQSGRLELAQWLSSPRNPLASRVMVNRIWHHLFGSGLVKTVDNFGVNGETPSHPELLDHLATRFIRDGWSIKKLVRSILLTRAYRLSSSAPAENVAVDPDNRLVWRHSPRRLDAEEIRDATLAAAGQLDLSRPAGSPAMDLPVIELANNGPEAGRLAAAAAQSRHRSVYLPLLRGLTPNSLAAFDFAEQGMVTGARDTTTVAPQALYLLNDPFVRVQSRALAERLLQPAKMSDVQRIDLAYRVALGRSATATETARAAEYLAEYAVAVKESLDADRVASVAGKGAAVKQTAGKQTAGKQIASNPAASKPTVGKQTAGKQTAGKSNRPKNQKPAVRKVSQSATRSLNSGVRQRPTSAVEEPVSQPPDPKLAAWVSFCQALFGAAEFRYLR